jgi:hypothetical protein
MNKLEIAFVVAICTAVAVHLWRQKKQESARVDEVYNRLSLLQRLARSEGDLDRSHDLAAMVEALDEGRRLDMYPRSTPELDPAQVVRGIYFATDMLASLNMHSDNRRMCSQALLNLSARVRKRHIPQGSTPKH